MRIAVVVSWRFLILLLVLPLFPTVTGCAGIAREVAKEGSPGGVEGALSSVDDPGKQQQLGDVLDGPAGEGLGRGFTRGAVAETLAMATGATQPSPRPTTGPVNTASNYPWATYGSEDRPSVRKVVRDAALGLNDAFAQSGRDGNDAGVLAGTRNVLGTIATIAIAVVAILALLVVALALSVWRVLAKAQKARDESRLHEAGTARLLEALRAAEGKPWAPEFQAVLQESLDRPVVETPKRSRKRSAEARDEAESDWRAEDGNGEKEAAQREVVAHPGRIERAMRD